MKRKMKNKKGFTLVELLAVIVILGVLLLIAVPSVTTVINNSKKKSFESTANLVIENVKTIASLENGSLSECYIPLLTVNGKLERGSLGTNFNGYVLVSSTGEISLYYSDGSYKIEGGKLNDLGTTEMDSAVSDTPSTTTTVCSWY